MNLFDAGEEFISFEPDAPDADFSQQDLNLLKGQICASAIYMIVLIITIVVLYNQILEIEGKETFLEKETISDLNILNRVIILLIVLYFLYMSYQNFIHARDKGEDTKYLFMQEIASVLTVVSALVVLYISFQQSTKPFIPVASTENPNL